jgi:hypothetical protein
MDANAKPVTAAPSLRRTMATISMAHTTVLVTRVVLSVELMPGSPLISLVEEGTVLDGWKFVVTELEAKLHFITLAITLMMKADDF